MMWSLTPPSPATTVSPPFLLLSFNHSRISLLNSRCSSTISTTSIQLTTTTTTTTTATTKLRASLEDSSFDTSPTIVIDKNLPTSEIEQSIEVLKNAAKTRKVPKNEVLSALSVIEKAKLDPAKFLQTLGGTKSPGRTWMLIFAAEKQLKGGRYFPLTAVQRFDAEAKRIENGVFLGSLGSLTFEGRISWKNRILAFIFERIRLKVGPFNPLEVSLGNEDNSEPSSKNPFFIWFYVDEEIAVARGKSGGTAFWCRCRRVTNP